MKNIFYLAIVIGILGAIASFVMGFRSPTSVDPAGTAALAAILGFASGAAVAAGLLAEMQRRDSEALIRIITEGRE